MADRRRNRPTPDNDAPLTGEIPVDDGTAAALAMFNARLAAQAETERAAKRVERAVRAKDAAAARVREMEGDTKATADERSEATAAYHAAVEALGRARKGEPDPPPSEASTPEGQSDADATPADPQDADEAAQPDE